MVFDVGGPQNSTFVAHPVKPLVTEVVKYRCQNPGPNTTGAHEWQGKMINDEVVYVSADAKSNELSSLTECSKKQTAHRIVNPVAVAVYSQAPEQL